MGSWMTVQIIGTCGEEDIEALDKAIRYDECDFYPLSYGGSIFGLPKWACADINVTGNCAERDYGPGDIAETLKALHVIAPSLNVKVHCGGAYESLEVQATVTLVDGKVSICPPEVEEIGKIPESQMRANLFKAVQGGRQRK